VDVSLQPDPADSQGRSSERRATSKGSTGPAGAAATGGAKAAPAGPKNEGSNSASKAAAGSTGSGAAAASGQRRGRLGVGARGRDRRRRGRAGRSAARSRTTGRRSSGGDTRRGTRQDRGQLLVSRLETGPGLLDARTDDGARRGGGDAVARIEGRRGRDGRRLLDRLVTAAEPVRQRTTDQQQRDHDQRPSDPQRILRRRTHRHVGSPSSRSSAGRQSQCRFT
jgi:hypothetical protein